MKKYLKEHEGIAVGDEVKILQEGRGKLAQSGEVLRIGDEFTFTDVIDGRSQTTYTKRLGIEYEILLKNNNVQILAMEEIEKIEN